MQKTPFGFLSSDLGVSGLGGVLMYNPWKPQETLFDTSVLKPVLQATQDSTTGPSQTFGTGYSAFVLPAVQYCSFSMCVLPPVHYCNHSPVPGTVRQLVHLAQAPGSPCTFPNSVLQAFSTSYLFSLFQHQTYDDM